MSGTRPSSAASRDIDRMLHRVAGADHLVAVLVGFAVERSGEGGRGDTRDVGVDGVLDFELFGGSGFDPLPHLAQRSRRIRVEIESHIGCLDQDVGHAAVGDVDDQPPHPGHIDRLALVVDERRLVVELGAHHLAVAAFAVHAYQSRR